MDKVDCVVIGAGVVGLAVARELAVRGREVVIAESTGLIGSGVSSRNSEVIHAGLYYTKGSLKARLCVEGKQRLYAFCESHGVAHSRCGKLLVATSKAELAKLDAVRASAAANGVLDLEPLSAAQASALEPALQCEAAVFSPSTGIVDSHGFMVALLGDAERHGASLALNTQFVGARRENDLWALEFLSEGEPFNLHAETVVNCAGLYAQAVAAKMKEYPRQFLPRQWLAKGCYFSLSGKAPFSRLIYPMPSDGGLGVHLTLDMGGQAKFGPDVEWLESWNQVLRVPSLDDAFDYEVAASRADSFYAEVRRYWPELKDEALVPSYSGIRPKLSGHGEPPADFQILGPSTHGMPGLVQMFGVESPGLTASMAIAAHAARLLQK